jgi:predicted nucleic acid-binding protein
METWSEPIAGNFTIRIFLDTNVLCFYIDKTYTGVNRALEFLGNSDFAVLLSSESVLLELANLRKRTHHLKCIEESFPEDVANGNIKLDEVYKILRNEEDFDKLPYVNIVNEVKPKVFKEINDFKK